MSWIALVAVYFLVWWTSFLAVLPFGIRTQDEDGEILPGSPASAPARPRLVRAAVITTVISTVAVGLLHLVFSQGWIDIWNLPFRREANW